MFAVNQTSTAQRSVQPAQSGCTAGTVNPSRLARHSRSAGVLHRGGLFGGSVPVGAPNDHREQEADRIADLVVTRTGPGQGAVSAARRGDTERSPAPTARAPGDLEQFQGMNGRALEPAARNYFEPRFGYDFSRVRVFEDGAAEAAARSMGAEAFTLGGDIVSGRRGLTMDDAASRRLLAHELTHTIQQGAALPLADATAPSALVRPARTAPMVQRRTLGIAGACWFQDCDAQLENFFMIPEDGPPGFHPSGSGTFRVDDIDGLWFRHHTPKSEWFKIPDIGTGQVTCNDDEQNPEITSPVIPFATAGWVSDRIHTPNPY